MTVSKELQSIIELIPANFADPAADFTAVRAMFALPFPLGFKVALEARGFEMGPPKQPLSDAEQFKYGTVKARIEKIMNPILENLTQHAGAAHGTERI